MATPESARKGTTEPGAAPRPCDLLIRGAHVLTMDAKRTVHEDGAVAVDGRDIAGVGPTADVESRFLPKRVIDARGGPLHPGFVDLHYHATVHIISKLIPDAPADSRTAGPWVADRYTRFHNVAEEADDHAAATLAALEMALSGITAFMDPGTAFDPDVLADAVEAVGIRGSVADAYLMDNEGPQLRKIARAPVDRRRCLDQLGRQLRRNRDADALVRGHVAIYGMGSQTVELMAAAKKLADDAGAPFTMHQSMCLDDAEFDDRRLGRHPMAFWAEKGLLGPSCAFVHMNVLRDDEIEPIVASGMSPVWCPGNSLFYATRRAIPNRLPELARRGVNVTFGTDVCKTWTFAHNMLLAYYIAREEDQYLSALDLIAMQTANGARAIGLGERAGSIEPGKRADLVIRTNDAPEALPVFDVPRRVALHGLARTVDTVIVDGRVVVKGGRHAWLDEGHVYAKAKESAARLLKRVES